MAIEEKLAELGLTLPEAGVPVGSYVPVKIAGNLAFVSGMLPTEAGRVKQTGRVGEDITTDEAYSLARVCAVNGLAALKGAIGTLDRVKGIAMVQGFVQGAPGYAEVPKVINGASDLLVALFGDAGRHARFAVGVASLPMNAPVEVAFVAELMA
ncbi:MAG TPA: RidA family protein [Clostridia bacterium]|nr:RidA family protein [Clostridia bacterium]